MSLTPKEAAGLDQRPPCRLRWCTARVQPVLLLSCRPRRPTRLSADARLRAAGRPCPADGSPPLCWPGHNRGRRRARARVLPAPSRSIGRQDLCTRQRPRKVAALGRGRARRQAADSAGRPTLPGDDVHRLRRAPAAGRARTHRRGRHRRHARPGTDRPESAPPAGTGRGRNDRKCQRPGSDPSQPWHKPWRSYRIPASKAPAISATWRSVHAIGHRGPERPKRRYHERDCLLGRPGHPADHTGDVQATRPPDSSRGPANPAGEHRPGRPRA
jgi:hypothetical protein